MEDDLLAFLEPQETASALLARTFVEPLRSSVPIIDQHVLLRPGHILEVAGPAGSGKSQILLQVDVYIPPPPFSQPKVPKQFP